MSASLKTASEPLIEEIKSREDAAWRKVIARETGQKYLSKYQIKTDTKLPPRRIRAMVDRCRVMRKTLGFDVELPGDWWAARLMPLDTPTGH